MSLYLRATQGNKRKANDAKESTVDVRLLTLPHPSMNE